MTTRQKQTRDAERDMTRRALERDGRSQTVRELELKLDVAMQVIAARDEQIARLKRQLINCALEDE